MINALHLLWIIPLVGFAGFMAAALLGANSVPIPEGRQVCPKCEKEIEHGEGGE